jgi:phosphopantothenoylcysteine decarboxylase
VPADRVIYIIVCAAPPASEVQTLVKLTRDKGWITYVITTPDAVPWLDIDVLTKISGYPVRSEYLLPGEGKSLPLLMSLL